MRRFTTVMFASAMLLGTAQGERHVAPVRPYEPVAVTLPAPQADDALDTLRLELARVAKAKIYADLARLVAARGFFWGRDIGDRFDPRKPGVDNLAAALRLEHDGGAGWADLERLAGEPGTLPLESRPGVVCAPAVPRFDTIAFDRLVEATRTEAGDWSYARFADVAIRAAARTDATAIEVLGLHFVRVLEPGGSRHAGWTQVVAPSGAVGFVAPDTLRPLNAAQLCYGKDLTGRWQVAGYISAGD